MSLDTRYAYVTPEGALVTPRNARQWCAVIIKLPSLAERRAAFDQVPQHLRDLVKTMLHNAWNHPARSKQ